MTGRVELSGHEAAASIDFAAFYRERWQPMVRLASLLTGDVADAEDAVQDAFLGVYRQRVRLTDRRGAEVYLSAAVVNSCRSRARRKTVLARALRRLVPERESMAGADDEIGGDTLGAPIAAEAAT